MPGQQGPDAVESLLRASPRSKILMFSGVTEPLALRRALALEEAPAARARLLADLAAMPLLWVIPLGLYLLTFVFVFSSRRWFSSGIACPCRRSATSRSQR